MSTSVAEQKTAFIVAAKKSFRDAHKNQTWEQRVQAIARMNVDSQLAKAAMLKARKTMN